MLLLCHGPLRGGGGTVAAKAPLLLRNLGRLADIAQAGSELVAGSPAWGVWFKVKLPCSWHRGVVGAEWCAGDCGFLPV